MRRRSKKKHHGHGRKTRSRAKVEESSGTDFDSGDMSSSSSSEEEDRSKRKEKKKVHFKNVTGLCVMGYTSESKPGSRKGSDSDSEDEVNRDPESLLPCLTGALHRSDRCRAFSGNPVVFY